jgi:hypothetical protein
MDTNTNPVTPANNHASACRRSGLRRRRAGEGVQGREVEVGAARAIQEYLRSRKVANHTISTRTVWYGPLSQRNQKESGQKGG